MVRIGITTRSLVGDDRARGSRRRAQWSVEVSLHDAVYAAGAVAIALAPPPPEADLAAAVAAALPCVDALLLQGGGDLGRGRAPAESHADALDDRRDAFEVALLAAAMASHRPVLGVCRGMQLINVALGGSLLDEVERPDLHGARHADPSRYDRHRHAVALAPDGRLAELYGCTRGSVSSAHRQGVARLGDGLLIEATCPDDGLVEALRAGDGYVLGVQWHPEFLGDGEGELAGGRLFSDLARAATAAKEAAGR